MTVAMLTVGEIARQLGVKIHKVEYVVASRNIEPAGRAGNLRVFTEADVKHIQSELTRIEEDRLAGAGV